jgi:small GTP-binding protein
MYLNNHVKNRDYDIGIKISIIGLNGVGKTSLLYRYCDEEFKKNCMATVGIDFRTKLVEKDGMRIKLHIWDTAGLEQYKSLTKTFYRYGDIVILAYDTTNRKSFKEVDFFKKETENHRSDQKFILVGTKIDLGHLRSVEKDEAKIYAEQNGFDHCEISAKHNTGVEELFDSIINMYIENLQSKLQTEQKENESQDNSGCCMLL